MASLKQVQDQREKDEAGYPVEMLWRNRMPWLSSDGKTPVTFTVYGSEAPTYLKLRGEMYREAAKTGEELDDNTALARIAACAIKGWAGIDEPCTVENARAMMSFEFLRLQVERASTRGADFFGADSTG